MGQPSTRIRKYMPVKSLILAELSELTALSRVIRRLIFQVTSSDVFIGQPSTGKKKYVPERSATFP